MLGMGQGRDAQAQRLHEALVLLGRPRFPRAADHVLLAEPRWLGGVRAALLVMLLRRVGLSGGNHGEGGRDGVTGYGRVKRPFRAPTSAGAPYAGTKYLGLEPTRLRRQR